MARDASQAFWENSSARLAARINLAGWLERFAPISFALCGATAVALYALRRTAGPVQLAWPALLAGVTGAAVVAWWRSRAGRFRATDARVLLESTLRLDARLSAAADGVTAWPARIDLPAVVRWRSLAAPGWLLAAAGLLAVGAWAPLIGGGDVARRPVEKPPALAQTEAMLQELARLDVADPVSLDQLAAQVRELAERSPEEQYTHSALEAADALRDQTMAAVQNLARGYDGASGALAPFEAREATAGDERLKGAGDQLSAALDGLRTGRLSGNSDLTSLIEAARNSLGQLSPEQIRQLRERLNSAGGKAGGIAGAAGAGARIAQRKEGEGEGYGNGGLTRGRGDAPLTMNEQLSAQNDGKIQGVSGIDFSRAQLGDLAGVEQGGAHEVDPAKAAALGSAGTVAAPARGGEAVWVDRLSPSDRAVLKELFK